jgi:hypothetical protein
VTSRRKAALITSGRIAAVLSLVLCLLLQAVNHDFFPPQVSVSQYGIGPRGWVFTCWTVVVAVAAAALHAGGGADRFRAGRWIATGGVALVIMGAVRTDADGLQHSLHAKVHMAASIVALAALPIGMALAMSHARAWLRRTGWLLVLGISVSLVMVLVSAAGVGTPGFDPAQSWALWQAVAVSLDMVLIAAFALSSFPRHQAHQPAAARRGSTVPAAGAGAG